jgi:glucosamine 6-phosphate synthetase-like amidotransferase/phosphosugar isomerase protein
MHAEGFAAGELKHGPIAWSEPPGLRVVPPRAATSARQGGQHIQEIRARGR